VIEHFEVMHLPGIHRAVLGSGAKDGASCFSGDAIYDGALLDFLPDSDVQDYIRTMKRLRALPVTIGTAGTSRALAAHG